MAVAVLAGTLGGGRGVRLSELRTVAEFQANGGYMGGVPTGVDSYDEKYVDGAVWSLDAGGSVVKINPKTRQVVLPVAVGQEAGWTVGGGAVWVVSADKPIVTRVDTKYGSTSQIRLPTTGSVAAIPPVTRSHSVTGRCGYRRTSARRLPGSTPPG